ncbi:MAG: flagellar hook-length control protein FliK [Pseudomonadota bacterium]
MIGLEGFGAQTADASARKPSPAKAQPNEQSNRQLNGQRGGDADGRAKNPNPDQQREASPQGANTPDPTSGAAGPASQARSGPGGTEVAATPGPIAPGFDTRPATAGEADFADVLTALTPQETASETPVLPVDAKPAAAPSQPIVPGVALTVDAPEASAPQPGKSPDEVSPLAAFPKPVAAPPVTAVAAAPSQIEAIPLASSPGFVAEIQTRGPAAATVAVAQPAVPQGPVAQAPPLAGTTTQASDPAIENMAVAQIPKVAADPVEGIVDEGGGRRIDTATAQPAQIPTTVLAPPQPAGPPAPVAATAQPLQGNIAQPAAISGREAGLADPLALEEAGLEISNAPTSERRAAALQPVLVHLPANGRPTAHAAAIANHLAAAVSRPGQDRVEIRLDPPELGRVSMTLAINDQVVTALISAERPEIADLMRRHADLLQRDLAEAGYDGVDLQFGTAERGDGQDTTGFDLAAIAGIVAGSAPADQAATTPQASPLAGGNARLDIRI